ncbi:LOW QUALITY PROTEIN: RNA 3'-terminal phosphate cyclase-like [Octopus sinensis]|uniref:RNA 3'-terminal phosphate cyclase n=1 Tax=Octopus sinensis TaxID=2607531 RepID=A0A6P7TU93_9MOLL|nr:LOW QUALITY PROTEIN: RNA 3'-terminal phosphate cyclase-like [Octopus sinensis]
MAGFPPTELSHSVRANTLRPTVLMYLKILTNTSNIGGGQILRNALSLSSILNQPMEIHNIRGGRPIPGLVITNYSTIRPQHLACVNIISEISSAKISQTSVGTLDLTYCPGNIHGGNYVSISLIIQAALPCLVFAGASSHLTLCGGTDVPTSPPIKYYENVVLKNIHKFGVNASIKTISRGLYPKGGGKVELSVPSQETPKAVEMTESGDSVIFGNREDPIIVGEELGRKVVALVKAEICLDEYMQDQVVLWMALAEGRSRILCGDITLHTQSSILLIEQFLSGVKFEIKSVSPGKNLISCTGFK